MSFVEYKFVPIRQGKLRSPRLEVAIRPASENRMGTLGLSSSLVVKMGLKPRKQFVTAAYDRQAKKIRLTIHKKEVEGSLPVTLKGGNALPDSPLTVYAGSLLKELKIDNKLIISPAETTENTITFSYT